MSSSSGNRGPDEAADRELDLSGEVCPYTFVRTRLTLEEMSLGARLCVFVDHEPATRNIPRSAEAWGQEVEGVDARDDGRWSIAIVKRVP